MRSEARLARIVELPLDARCLRASLITEGRKGRGGGGSGELGRERKATERRAAAKYQMTRSHFETVQEKRTGTMVPYLKPLPEAQPRRQTAGPRRRAAQKTARPRQIKSVTLP